MNLARFLKALAGACMLAASALAMAQAFPSKPIQIVVGLAPGSAADRISREVIAGMQKHLGQPVVIVNKPSANSLIAAETVRAAAPDGYTLLMGSTNWGNVPLMYRKPPYRRDEFVAAGFIVEDYAALVGNPKAGATVQEWVAGAKAEPKKYNVATLGSASSARMLAEQFGKSAGVSFTEVPYQGAAAAVVALQAGDVQAYFGDAASSIPLHQAGRVRILAVTRPQRLPSLPQVPTFAEIGMPEMSLKFWYGFLAPAGTPAPVIARINEAVNAALADPEVRKRLEANGGSVKQRSAAEFQALIQSEAEVWRAIIEPLNIKLD